MIDDEKAAGSDELHVISPPAASGDRELAVTESDKELAIRIVNRLVDGVPLPEEMHEVAAIIAAHMAKERGEAEQTRKHLNDVQEILIRTNDRMGIKDKALTNLQQQLAASQRRVRELETTVKRCVEFKEHPATADAEGGGA